MFILVIGKSAANNGVAANTIYRIDETRFRWTESNSSNRLTSIEFVDAASNPFGSTTTYAVSQASATVPVFSLIEDEVTISTNE